MGEERYIRIKNFSNIWKLDIKIYTIQDFKLPFPIDLKKTGIYLVSFFLLFFLNRIIPIPGLSNPFNMLLLPALITWVINNQKLDGRKIHTWILSQIVYVFSPKKLCKFKPIKLRSGVKFNQKIVFRRGRWNN